MLPDSYRALRTIAVLALIAAALAFVLAVSLSQHPTIPRAVVWTAAALTVALLLILVRAAVAFDRRSDRAREWRTFR
jgi:uncharacterized membrane protein YjfL (UPF0719 family)